MSSTNPLYANPHPYTNHVLHTHTIRQSTPLHTSALHTLHIRQSIPLHSSCSPHTPCTPTPSGRIYKVVASNAVVVRSIPGWAETAPICTMHEARRGDCPWGWGCDQSIWSTVPDAIVRSWLWSTATRSSPLGYFSRLLQVVDNWPQILW